MLVAQHPMRSGERQYSRGAPVPEAATWPNRAMLLRTGRLRWDPSQAPIVREIVERMSSKSIAEFCAAHGITVGAEAQKSEVVEAVIAHLAEALKPPL